MSKPLSNRERACLSWAALGKSSWEIGQILSISENTVIFHIKNAMKKLGTNNRVVAAVKAVQLGLIESSAQGDPPSILRRYDPPGVSQTAVPLSLIKPKGPQLKGST